jgi:site-specific recombinase XerD
VFENLFSKYPRVRARHEKGPAAEARQRFLKYCSIQGMARATLLRHAREVLVIAARIDVTNGRAITRQEIEAAADRWARDQLKQNRVQKLSWSRALFIRTATAWLGFLQVLEKPESKPSPGAAQIADFAAYMQNERGLSPVTIRNQCWHVEKFGQWLQEQNRAFLGDVSLEDVDSFLAGKGRQGWTRVSVAAGAKALRAFFRHAGKRGWCAVGISSGIDGPRIFKYEGLPAGPDWEDIQRLIGSAGGDQPRNIRDKAILMLLALYGFRSGEVSRRRLDDVNWEHDVISIVRPKQRRAQPYPLTTGVGDALLRYLREVRPGCAHREIFLTLKAPFRPLSPGAMHHVVSSRLSQFDIRIPRRGPHSLRHACAGHLVAEGFSLKEIGDHLGHRSACATRIYAKVDVAGLREVANVDLGGLL